MDKKVEETIIDPITAKDEEIAKLTEERDNYKAAALLRKGKLPADSELLGEDFDKFLDEKVKTVLADKELQQRQTAKDQEIQKIIKENNELRLALKNRPGVSIGGGSGDNLEVKDNILSEAQIINLKARAVRLKVDPDKFVENAKANLLKNR